ncbi:MAG TPA: hypothetical protein VF148_01505 [Acidimicrobiia bacterium]
MNELWVRVALVTGALAIAGVIALVRHRHVRAGVHTVNARSLDAGVYFFSSATCATCVQARAKLDSALGGKGYREFAWESEPDAFTQYGVDQVPAVMVVDDGGRGRVYPGQPDRALGP